MRHVLGIPETPFKAQGPHFGLRDSLHITLVIPLTTQGPHHHPRDPAQGPGIPHPRPREPHQNARIPTQGPRTLHPHLSDPHMHSRDALQGPETPPSTTQGDTPPGPPSGPRDLPQGQRTSTHPKDPSPTVPRGFRDPHLTISSHRATASALGDFWG